MTSAECSPLIAPLDGKHETRVRTPWQLPGPLGEYCDSPPPPPSPPAPAGCAASAAWLTLALRCVWVMIAGDPFRKMIDCDAVNRRLAWILGPEFIVTGSYAIVSQYGAAGQRMHAGPWYNWGHHYRLPGSGRPPLRSPGLNLGWALRDVDTDRGDGGVHSPHNIKMHAIDAYSFDAHALRSR